MRIREKRMWDGGGRGGRGHKSVKRRWEKDRYKVSQKRQLKEGGKL